MPQNASAQIVYSLMLFGIVKRQLGTSVCEAGDRVLHRVTTFSIQIDMDGTRNEKPNQVECL